MPWLVVVTMGLGNQKALVRCSYLTVFIPSIEISLQYHRNFFQRITFISCIFFSFQGESSYGSQFIWVLHSAINSSSCPWVFRYTAVKERTNILGLSCYCLYSSRHPKFELTAISLFHVYTLHYDQDWKVLNQQEFLKHSDGASYFTWII